MTLYPKQIFCVWGEGISMDAACELQTPKEDSTTSPLEMHEGNLSRFALTVLDRSSGAPIAHKANIPTWDIPLIKEKTQIALLRKVDAEKKGEEEEETSIAYQKMIPFGRYRNQTPAEVLLADNTAKDELRKTAKLLSQNLKKYPDNQLVIDAIEEGITLLEVGELTAPSKESSMMIYERNYKHSRKPGADGFYDMFNIAIRCNYKLNYPWEISIFNGRVKLTKSPDGKTMPDMKGMKDRKRAAIKLRDDDWIPCIDKLYTVIKLFENMNFADLYTKSQEMVFQQIEQYKAEKKGGVA